MRGQAPSEVRPILWRYYNSIARFRLTAFIYRKTVVRKRLLTGQAAVLGVLFVMAALLAATFGTAAISITETRVAEENTRSRRAYFAAEAGIEDAVYRTLRNKNLTSSFALSLNNATAITTVAAVGNNRTITAEGESANAIRGLRVEMKESTDEVQFFYGVQVGDGGLEMENNSVVNGNIYSNGNVIGSNGARITGDVIVAGGINETPSVEWTIHNDNQFFATTSSNRDIAQSFAATASGKLNKVSVYLGKVGNPSSNLTLRITADNNNKPSTSDLVNVSISPASVGVTPSWIDLSFLSPPNLVSGTKYWIVLDYGSSSAANYWNWRKDTSDGYGGQTGKYTSNWSSGSASWTHAGGDLAFRAWIGGANTRVENVAVGDAGAGTGIARANAFVNVTVQGSACPNSNCVVDNPSRIELPIPDGVIQDWRNDAAVGGICGVPTCDSSGNYMLTNNESGTLGPVKISGNLTITNGAILTITGIIWVAGNIVLSNNCGVFLDSSYGANSGVILADGTITVSNGCVFQGSGDPDSYIMALSAKNAPASEVIRVSNNAVGIIYYASGGKLELENNASAKEAVAYAIELENNTTITYESGLANLNFSSGPTGGWIVESWREIEP